MKRIIIMLTLISSIAFAENDIENRRTGEKIRLECATVECTLFDVSYIDEEGNIDILRSNLTDVELNADIYNIRNGSFGLSYKMSTKVFYESNPLISYTLFSFITVPVLILETGGAIVRGSKKNIDHKRKERVKEELKLLRDQNGNFKVSNKRFEIIKEFFL